MKKVKFEFNSNKIGQVEEGKDTIKAYVGKSFFSMFLTVRNLKNILLNNTIHVYLDSYKIETLTPILIKNFTKVIFF